MKLKVLVGHRIIQWKKENYGRSRQYEIIQGNSGNSIQFKGIQKNWKEFKASMKRNKL